MFQLQYHGNVKSIFSCHKNTAELWSAGDNSASQFNLMISLLMMTLCECIVPSVGMARPHCNRKLMTSRSLAALHVRRIKWFFIRSDESNKEASASGNHHSIEMRYHPHVNPTPNQWLQLIQTQERNRTLTPSGQIWVLVVTAWDMTLSHYKKIDDLHLGFLNNGSYKRLGRHGWGWEEKLACQTISLKYSHGKCCSRLSGSNPRLWS